MSTNKYYIILALFINTIYPISAHSQPARVDRFEGTLVLKDFEESGFRKYKLGEDLKYIDPKGIEWYAREGLITDGATIPRFLWSIIGSPYTGNYRRAAIIHDYYCTHYYREWQPVSNMFYNAMLTDGVPTIKALLMYYAVVRFGPKWTIDEIETCPARLSCFKPGDIAVSISTPKIDASEIDGLKREMEDIKQNIEQFGTSKEELAIIAHNKPPLYYVKSSDKISDNWIDYRNRHKNN